MVMPSNMKGVSRIAITHSDQSTNESRHHLQGRTRTRRTSEHQSRSRMVKFVYRSGPSVIPLHHREGHPSRRIMGMVGRDLPFHDRQEQTSGKDASLEGGGAHQAREDPLDRVLDLLLQSEHMGSGRLLSRWTRDGQLLRHLVAEGLVRGRSARGHPRRNATMYQSVTYTRH